MLNVTGSLLVCWLTILQEQSQYFPGAILSSSLLIKKVSVHGRGASWMLASLLCAHGSKAMIVILSIMYELLTFSSFFPHSTKMGPDLHQPLCGFRNGDEN